MAIVFLFINVPALLTPSSQALCFDAHSTILPEIDQEGPRSTDPAGQDAGVLRLAVEEDAGAASTSPDRFPLRFRS